MAHPLLQGKEIRAVFAQYADGCRCKDIRKILDLCSSEITGFGSGPDEVVRGKTLLKEILRRDLSQADQISVAFPGMEMHGLGAVALVTSGCSFTFVSCGVKQNVSGRFTAVMRNTGRWLIEQIHFSMPFGAQKAGQSYPGAGG